MHKPLTALSESIALDSRLQRFNTGSEQEKDGTEML